MQFLVLLLSATLATVAYGAANPGGHHFGPILTKNIQYFFLYRGPTTAPKKIILCMHTHVNPRYIDFCL